jgi:hypothetical protein
MARRQFGLRQELGGGLIIDVVLLFMLASDVDGVPPWRGLMTCGYEPVDVECIGGSW